MARPTAGTRARVRTVLLVDDDRFVRKVTQQMLLSQNLNVVEAGGGPEALDIWDASQLQPDLVLTDINMPEMSGIDLIQHLVQRGKNLKALYMSGFTELAGSVPARLFIAKPFSRGELASKVWSALNRPLHGWTCEGCADTRYQGLAANDDGDTLALTLQCGNCAAKQVKVVDVLYPLECCPFCEGQVLLSADGYIGDMGDHLGQICDTCCAQIVVHSMAFANAAS
jgi:two-component system, chemotaxis family, chemotaxis protein CheY